MDANYSIKLSDFGFARDNMIKKNGKIKTSKTFCGSYAYASPEILNCIPYQPNASDIWSIGIILYAIMYKALPFNDPDPDKLIKVSGQDCLKYNNIIVNSNKVVKYCMYFNNNYDIFSSVRRIFIKFSPDPSLGI